MKLIKKYMKKKGSFVDLARAMGHLTGAIENTMDDKSREICQAIGKHRHYIFVLVDGMGTHLLKRLPSSSFLRKVKNITNLKSVIPSTTATAITAMATGQHPSIHGVSGWFMYLKEKDISITPLLYRERFGGELLQNLDVKFENIWSIEPLMKKMKCDTFAVMSNDFVNSMFSKYLRGDSKAAGYTNITEAIDLTIQHINSTDEDSYTYLYLHEYDKACHEFGVSSKEADMTLMAIDREIKRLFEAVSSKSRIVITADHGLIDVKKEDRIILRKDDPLMEYLLAPPSGDSRFITFYVKENNEDKFKYAFNKRFKDKILLLTFEEIDELGLLGPEKVGKDIMDNFGDFVGICIGDYAFNFSSSIQDDDDFPIGVHSGLTENETCVPLIIL